MVRRLFVALGVVAATLVVVASGASAALMTVPASDGSYVICTRDAVAVPPVSFPNSRATNARLSCNYAVPASIGGIAIDQANPIRFIRVVWSNGADHQANTSTQGLCGESGTVATLLTIGTQLRLTVSDCASMSSTTGGPSITAVYIDYKRAAQSTSAGQGAGRLEGSYAAGTFPPYSADYFPGGTTGEAPPTPAPVACSRVLDRSAMSAKFKVDSRSGSGTGYSDSYSWAFGDGTGASSSAAPTHVYPALSTQPENGWTATLTLSRVGDGSTYASSTVTATCGLRVDFLNPSEATPSSTSGDTRTDSCDHGWGFLSPSAWGDLMRCLFIPSGEGLTAIRSTWADAGAESILVPFGVIQGSFQAVSDGVASTDNQGCSGPTAAVPLGNSGQSFQFSPLSTCDQGGSHGTLVADIASVVRRVLMLSIMFGSVLAAKQLVGGLFGGRGGSE